MAEHVTKITEQILLTSINKIVNKYTQLNMKVITLSMDR